MLEGLLTYIKTKQQPISESLKECDLEAIAYENDSPDELLDLTKKNINVFPFSNVRPCWFQLHANLCIAKAAQSLQTLDPSTGIDTKGNSDVLSKAVASLDNALIIAGGGNEETKNLIYEILRGLDRTLNPHDTRSSDDDVTEDLSNDEYVDDGNQNKDEKIQAPPTKKRRLDPIPTTKPIPQILPSNLAFVPRLTSSVPHLNNPSLTTFESHIHNSNTPLILKNTLTHWPALTKWHDANYWLRRTLNGRRLVPVELGQSYTDEDWRQEIMTFKRFLEEYILKGDDAEEIGYLAQHDLFSQIPELRADVAIPDYCFADVPVEVHGGSASDVKEQMENGTGLTKNNDFQTVDNSLSVKSTHQASAKSPTRPENSSTSDEKTKPEPPAMNIRDHDHETQFESPNHTDTESDPSASPSLTPSPSDHPPLQIHQNIWFGTRTVTPLHHDPYSNILTQIHGTKYIRLYSPAYTALLYPRSAQEVAPHVVIPSDTPQSPSDCGRDDEGSQQLKSGETQPQPPPAATIDMSNTSTVPLWSMEQSPHEDWDEQYPGFSSIAYVETLLGEGDAVYIPKGWWHYVRGVSAVGIGVSFWW